MIFTQLFLAACGTLFPATGIYICATQESSATIKFKLPANKGQFIPMDCDDILTDNKLPNDFNNTWTEKNFLLFWKRKFVSITESPSIIVPIKNNCPITSSISSDGTGTQNGIIVYHKFTTPTLNIAYTCGNDIYKTNGMHTGYSYGPGVGGCTALEQSNTKFTITPDLVPAIIRIESNCGQKDYKEALVEEPYTFNFKVQKGICVYDVRVINRGGEAQAKFLYQGIDREAHRIDSPVIIRNPDKNEDGHLSVYKPLGASIIQIEIYYGSKVYWRSGSRSDDRLDMRVEDANGILCAFAYSKDGAFSHECTDRKGNFVPRSFR